MSSEKIALVFPSNPWFCPYVSIYTNILKKLNLEFDLIYWNRFDKYIDDDLVYNHTYKKNSNVALLFYRYLRFCNFVKHKLKKGKYNKVIIFSSNVGIFCQPFLKRNFKNRYIFDFRDLLIEQKKIFRSRFKKLLQFSFANVISSPGFKECLPNEFSYIISHNFIKENVLNALNPQKVSLNNNPINVLTIGGIRIDCNPEIIRALGDKPNIQLSFVGKGMGSPFLQNIVKEDGYQNVSFEGYYDKESEPSFIKNSTFLNIYYPDILSHKTAMSNRFYNSIIFRRPMIVTKGQIQGYYCEKYNLGVAISDTENLSCKLNDWLNNTNYTEYDRNCINALTEFLQDEVEFNRTVEQFSTI